MSDPVKVNVTLTDQGLAEFERVAHELANRGLKITHRSENLGIISGEIDSSQRSKLKMVGGVDAVDDDQEMHAMNG